MDDITILEALFWGIVSVSGLILGSLVGGLFHFTHNTISKIMALAAGLLIAAATLELASEAMENISITKGLIALIAGGLGFSFGNALLSKKEAHNRKRCGACVSQPKEEDIPGSGSAILLGTAMDAVPEAIVLGLALFNQGINLPLILAIALGNFPEAISGTVGMLEAGRKKSWIFKVWGGVAVMTLILTMAGFLFAKYISHEAVAVLQLFGAGALIAMVSETLIPEAFHGTPKYSGTIVTIVLMLILLVQAIIEM